MQVHEPCPFDFKTAATRSKPAFPVFHERVESVCCWEDALPSNTVYVPSAAFVAEALGLSKLLQNSLTEGAKPTLGSCLEKKSCGRSQLQMRN